MNGTEIRIFIEEYSPATILRDSDECKNLTLFTQKQTDDCWTGSLILLLQFMSFYGNFTYSGYRARYFYSDEKNLSNVWTAAWTLLEVGELDAVLAYYWYDEGRTKMFRYLFPEYLGNDREPKFKLLDDGFVKNSTGSDWLKFGGSVKAFGVGVWAVMLICLIGVSGLVAVVESEGIGGFLHRFGWNLEQHIRIWLMRDVVARRRGSNKAKTAKNSAKSVAIFSWSFTSLIVASLFSGSIITTTTLTSGWSQPFTTLEGMYEAGFE